MDLIIVGDQSDRFCTEVLDLVQQIGYTADILNIYDAARLFSVGVEDGQVCVTPDIPLLLRIQPPSTIRKSFDDSFMYGECLSTLWAAATLNKSTVINRPTANGIWGKTSYSSVLTAMRGGWRDNDIELFSSQILLPATQKLNQQWYVQDLSTYNTTAYPNIPPGEGAYRGRWADFDPGYEVVVVLDNQAWRSTNVPLEHLLLEEKSISLIRNLDLTFATVTWSISENLEDATLARIDPFPMMEQIQFVWPVLAPALLEVLFS
ncbi:hypothetical protein [Nostoc sp. TCL26-01]|uniref:hypothetical protein n=1 Tax=Nostoc sp. TCL26-01 TaxID=2576904 RepID=UPI0015BBCCB1|nr:hypothetical protein [Nostoc sp. TCL26-01]QLE57059.1 hypothetical protein FD725_16955 [Nostoc sp. TCL26-01]